MTEKKPFIIAEIAQGYEGSEKLVELYVKAASAAGADAIKFQIFFADELALPDYKYYQLFKNLEIPFEVWKKAVEESHLKGMEFYSDIFGEESLSELERIGIDGYKIHTTDINNFRLLERIAKTGKKIFLSTGGAEISEINKALEIFTGRDVTLMYGFQAEPTGIEDNNLKRIETLRKMYGKSIGFQDHTAGELELALSLPFIAVGLGVGIIEKHLTLSRAAEIEDYISALTPEEFRKWASSIKSAYGSIGKEEWDLTEKELLYRGKVRRAVCSRRNIMKGEKINENDLILKRTDKENCIYQLTDVVGKNASSDIKENSVINKEDVL